MSFHRRVALVASAALCGLIGLANASNFAPPAKRASSVVVEPGLREKVQNAHVEGCGG